MTTGDQQLDALRRVVSTASLLPYDRFGVYQPELEWLPLSGERGSDFECFLLRFKPGAASLPHEHTAGEEFLVLEGELEDNDGRILKAGDFVVYEPGSKHFSRSPSGCLLLVILRGSNRLIETSEQSSIVAW